MKVFDLSPISHVPLQGIQCWELQSQQGGATQQTAGCRKWMGKQSLSLGMQRQAAIYGSQIKHLDLSQEWLIEPEGTGDSRGTPDSIGISQAPWNTKITLTN